VYARGKIARMNAEVDSRKRWLTMGTVPVPKNVTRISEVTVIWEPCKGPYKGIPDDQGRRYCQKDGRYHHLVPKPGERIYYTLSGAGMKNGDTVFPIIFGEGGSYRVEPPVELRNDPHLREYLRSLKEGRRTPG
jgi:hypothetical protein